MATTLGRGTALSNDVNVTPMIDVLLVLLVIFMMAVPMMRKAIDVQLPDPAPGIVDEYPIPIVLQVLPGGAYRINSEDVPKARLGVRLSEIFASRPQKLIFVKGSPTVRFQDVFFGMDVARAAGVKVIGIPPK